MAVGFDLERMPPLVEQAHDRQRAGRGGPGGADGRGSFGGGAVGLLYCKGVILIQSLGSDWPFDPLCTLNDGCDFFDSNPLLRMLEPNVRSARLLPVILPVPVTEGGTPTIVGGGVKMTLVPRSEPLVTAGFSSRCICSRAGETRSRPTTVAPVVVDGIRKTASPSGERPVAVALVDVVAEFDKPTP